MSGTSATPALGGKTKNTLPEEPKMPSRVDDCNYSDTQTAWSPFIRRNERNTFVFNHRDLIVEGNHPYVLEVDDGGYFQVLFQCTAPAFFTYTISGDSTAQPESSSGATLPDMVLVDAPLTTRGVTMRHDARFLRYRVTATVRDGLRKPVSAGAPVPPPPLPGRSAKAGADGQQQLYSVALDIWVATAPEWRLGIIGGVAASGLVDKKYAIKTDDKGTKTFEEDAAQDSRHVDVIALAHVYYSRTYLRALNFGAAFGIGTSGTTPRFSIGPSVVFGKYFVLTGGWAIGSVSTAPVGQDVGKPPVNGDNTLNALSTRVTTAKYVGIGFTWIDRRDQFAAALASASASGSVGSCVTSATPDPITFDENGEPSSGVTVEAGSDCTWNATVQTGAPRFTVVSGGSAKGKGTIKLHANHADGDAHADTLNVVGPLGSTPKSVKLTQAPASCVDPLGDPLDFGGNDQTKTIQVSTSTAGCKWTASINSASGFSVDPTTEQTGAKPVTVQPPSAGDKETTAELKVVGPAGAAPKILKLKQPKKVTP